MTSNTPKALIMNEEAMQRALARMAHEIIEQLQPMENVALAGIRRRGLPLARRLSALIGRYEGIRPPVGEIDITRYRDDIRRAAAIPEDAAALPFPVTGKTVVLVDDVICTGRTTRAAMEAVLSQGRAARICLAVLVDRGHRELPIRPDFVGKNIPTSHTERVAVHVTEQDGEDKVALYAAPDPLT